MRFWNDVRHGARLLARERTFTITAMLALALGIGATSTVFTLVNGIFIRDLPFEQPDRIVAISTRSRSSSRLDNMSVADLRDLQRSARLFDGIGATDQVPMTIGEQGQSVERVLGSYVTANAFSLIGRAPFLGRDFTPADDQPGATPVVILGYAMWRSRYGGDRGILGRDIRVNGVRATVIGVMTEGFAFPESSSIWQPLAQGPRQTTRGRDDRNIDAFGRMASGVTIEQAAADVDGVMGALSRQYPGTNRDVAGRVRPFRDLNTGGPVPIVTSALMASVTFLLLIACANVANLLLARGAMRAREISVRLSLGAARRHIVGQLLVENLLLAVSAGAIGLVLAAAGARLVQRAITGTGEPYWLRFPIDGRVLAFFAAVCLGTLLLFGMAPALHASRTSIAGLLNDAGRSLASGRRQRRWTGGLVVVQLALTITLLTAAGLTVRNALALSSADAGVDLTDGVVMRIELPARQYGDIEARRAFYRLLDERLGGLPGMRAGFGAWAPLAGAFSRPVSIEGRETPDPSRRPRVSNMIVGTRYFGALGIEPVSGRLLTARDGTLDLPAAVVNERFASLHFGTADPLGTRIQIDDASPATEDRWLTIVGVVPNVRHEDNDPRIVEPVVYTSYESTPLSFATLIVRSDQDLSVAVAAARRVVGEIDPDLPLFDVTRLEDVLAADLRPLWVFGSMFGLFAVAALGLAAVGVYGVTAYDVAQRTRDIGVRIALGASRADVWWTVSRRAAVQLGIGLAFGAAGALGIGQLLQGALSGIRGDDPVTMIAVAVILVGAAAAACIGPARRAMRVDPAAALRAE